MEISGREIADIILDDLKKKLTSLSKKAKKKPKLVVFSVRPQEEDLMFIKTKQKAAEKIGADFELYHFKRMPRFEDFAVKIRQLCETDSTTGVVIQKPLPAQLTTETLYNYIPINKEIEGHKYKSPFSPPIGLAVLTVLKYIYATGRKKTISNVLVDPAIDRDFFKKICKKKRIVVMGKGETGGKPIGDVLSILKINYINTHSKTPTASPFYNEADIIIPAVGKKVLTPSMLKKGVVLISVGTRREKDQWRGDYDTDEIKDIASFYTPTPGGIGPLDIAYLMYNLVEAFKLQINTRG